LNLFPFSVSPGTGNSERRHNSLTQKSYRHNKKRSHSQRTQQQRPLPLILQQSSFPRNRKKSQMKNFRCSVCNKDLPRNQFARNQKKCSVSRNALSVPTSTV
jgi:hypothetical protein